MVKRLFWLGIVMGCASFFIFLGGALINLVWKLIMGEIFFPEAFFTVTFGGTLVGMGWALVVFLVAIVIEEVRDII